MKTQIMLRLLALTVLLYCAPFMESVQAGPVSLQQIKALLPDDADLQGFTHLRPSSSNSGQATNSEAPDFVNLNQDITQWAPGRSATPNRAGTVDRIGRRFLAENGLYQISVDITLCSSPEAASDEVVNFRQNAQSVYVDKSAGDEQFVGDASWAAGTTTLLFVSSNMMVYISADRTPGANKLGNIASFPASALKAVACQILLRASRQTALTGVSTQNAHLAVNGHTLPKNALQVAGQTYVPAAEFARAMGLTSRWDNTTGALTFSGAGRKTVTLMADSTATSVGGTASAPLKTPVLKQSGQPVMTLADLLTVTGGRITGHSGNEVQIKG